MKKLAGVAIHVSLVFAIAYDARDRVISLNQASVPVAQQPDQASQPPPTPAE